MYKLQQLVPQIQTLKQLSSLSRPKEKVLTLKGMRKKKRQKITGEERRLQRGASMILEQFSLLTTEPWSVFTAEYQRNKFWEDK